MINAGDVLQIDIQHDEFGDRTVEFKSGEDCTWNKGGFVSTDDDSNITSTSQRINQKNMKPWQVSFTIGLNDEDCDYFQNLSGAATEATWTLTFMSGVIRTGTGTPVDPIEANEQAGTMSVKVQGSGQLNKI